MGTVTPTGAIEDMFDVRFVNGELFVNEELDIFTRNSKRRCVALLLYEGKVVVRSGERLAVKEAYEPSTSE